MHAVSRFTCALMQVCFDRACVCVAHVNLDTACIRDFDEPSRSLPYLEHRQLHQEVGEVHGALIVARYAETRGTSPHTRC